jgi:hypothetical protein
LIATSNSFKANSGLPAATQNANALFRSLVQNQPGHYLEQQQKYAILVTGTLIAMGDNTKIDLVSTQDVIVLGNVRLPGKGTELTVRSDSFTFVEGFLEASSKILVSGGVAADGGPLRIVNRVPVFGADSRGQSVYFGKTGQVVATAPGAQVIVRGGQDVEIHQALIAGGTVGPTGVTWAGEGSSVEITAGQQLLVGAPIQAAGDLTLRPGTAGTDDAGRNLVFGLDAGLNTAGLGPSGRGSSIRIQTQTDLEIPGNITAGATIRQSFGPSGELLAETYEWSGRSASIELEATGRILVGADVLDKDGKPFQRGAFLRASDRISIKAGGNSSGNGVVVYPTSGLSTNKSGSEITITTPNTADIQGMVVAGGEILLDQNQKGETVG